jgi:predicted LPLAT superfamily acyltransferase
MSEGHSSEAPRAELGTRDQAKKAAWLARGERGTLFGIRFVVMLTRLLGRGASRAFVCLLMVYYFMFGRTARRASRGFLSVALGRTATWWDAFRHLLTFGLVTLDRVFLLQGRSELFNIEPHGSEHLERLALEKRGAFLLGAHIGSFEALRARAGGTGRDVHVLAFLDNAKKINTVLAAIAPEMHDRVLPVGDFDSLLRAKDVIERGGFLGMLGDRTGLNDKTVEVTFLGRPAPLPAGPFLLASVLKCPVFLVFGIYRGGNHYEVRCEPFAERIELPRSGRDAAVRRYAQAYADRLSELALKHPYNWFNVYDFWNPSPAPEPR